MSIQFDPDKPYVKKRGMGQVTYEQAGARFTAGHKFMEYLEEAPKPKEPPKDRKDVRERAAAKIAKKKRAGKKDEDPLDGFRQDETPGAMSSAKKEDDAARRAEEHA
jgi:hypothetical protein